MAASEPRQHLQQIIDQLDEDLIPQALDALQSALQSIQQHPLETILRGVPGLRMPGHWPPRFLDFEPLPVTSSELPSDQLIRQRR